MSQGAPEQSCAEDDAQSVKSRHSWCIEDVIAAVCMALLAIVTLANVIVRYGTDASFAWTEELSVFVMVLMVFAGASAVALEDQHLRVEVLFESGGPARRRWLRRASRGASALAFLVLATLFARTGWDEYRYGELNSALDLPRWWFTAPLVALCALAVLRSFGLKLNVVRGSQ